MRRRFSSSVLLRLLCLLWLVFSGCARHEPSTASPARVLRISQRNEPADLDPARASLPDDFFVIRALGEGLLSPAPKGGAPQPAAAARFDISGDGLTYTFHLRPEARWSNGEPVTAMDFIASYRRLLTPGTASPKADLFFEVKNAQAFANGALANFDDVGFRAPDPHTLVVTLTRPAPRFPLYVASGPWIPVNPRVVAAFGRDWTQPAHYVGNGPFVLVEWRSQQRIVVRQNPRYHAAAQIGLDEIQFIRFDDEDSEERAYRTGQIDVTMAVPHTKLETYARERPTELQHAPLAETRFLSFNIQRTPLADSRVRRALALAIDRRRIVERVLLGGQEPAGRFLPPPLRSETDGAGAQNRHASQDEKGDSEDQPKRGPHLQSEQSFAPDTARQLLAAAGFPGGRNFPKLELSAWSPSQTPVLEAIQAMWREELGIEPAIAIREAKVHLSALRTGSYDIAFVTTLLDVLDPLALFADFAPGAANNFPHWRDDDFDHNLSLAQAETNLDRQADALRAAEERLLADAPIAPLYFNVRNYLRAPRVHGWQEDALWTRFYLNLIVDEK